MIETAPLTTRWTDLRPHPEQVRLATSPARFKVVPAGRRSGKTERAKRRLVLAALTAHGWPDPRFFAAAPTRDQAKAIYWADLKAMIPRKLLAEPPRETELLIRLFNGAEIQVVGLDKPQRIEGRPWNGGILDEYANMKSEAWPENVRPSLSDRRGWCWLIGVPEGRNHYYDLYRRARADDTGEWAAFSWKSAEILPPEEITAARRDLDEETFRQEYEADFVTFAGRVYYTFDERTHCTRELAYDPVAPLIFAFDFNVQPGVAIICQEQRLPNGQTGTGVIGEVWIERNSNTPAVCRRLIADWGGHRGPVRCYGDATGGARGTAKVLGSDWELIEQALRPLYHGRLTFRVPRANPAERARVNAGNARLRNSLGEIRLMIDPARAPHLIRDLEGVVWAADGETVEKKPGGTLTHLSDALTYYLHAEFPALSGPRVSVSELHV
jgi:Terminase large subunit, T4likevirus-type, N-terminal